MLPPLAGIDGPQPPPTGHPDDESDGASVDVKAGAGELVLSPVGRHPLLTVYFALAVTFHLRARDIGVGATAAAMRMAIFAAMTAKGPSGPQSPETGLGGRNRSDSKSVSQARSCTPASPRRPSCGPIS